MRVRLMIWIAAGTLAAACSDEPPVGPAGNAGGAALPVAVQPAVTPAPPPKADENAALAARVVAALRLDPGVGRLGIDVVSAEGVVTLFGTAPTPADRERAARVAAGVDGVGAVLNNLVIVAGS
jgi:hypothetical protein